MLPLRESDMSKIIGIGAAPKRKEDQRFITGRGNYVADIKRSDMSYGAFVRSPHAHATINAIDKQINSIAFTRIISKASFSANLIY